MDSWCFVKWHCYLSGHIHETMMYLSSWCAPAPQECFISWFLVSWSRSHSLRCHRLDLSRHWEDCVSSRGETISQAVTKSDNQFQHFFRTPASVNQTAITEGGRGCQPLTLVFFLLNLSLLWYCVCMTTIFYSSVRKGGSTVNLVSLQTVVLLWSRREVWGENIWD